MEKPKNPIRFEKQQLADGDLAASYSIRFTDAVGAERVFSSIYSKYTQETSYVLYAMDSQEKIQAAFEEILKYMEGRYGLNMIPVYYGDVDSMYAEPSDISKCFFRLNSIDFELLADWEDRVIALSVTKNGEDSAFPDTLAVELAGCVTGKSSKH